MPFIKVKGSVKTLQESQEYSRAVVELLRELRLKKGISQNKLAEMAGLSRATVQHLEKGIRNPTLIVCHALADAMGESLGDILRKIEAAARKSRYDN